MTRSVAVKTFLEKDSVRGKIPAGEFMEFWKLCSEEERTEFGAFAGKAIGVEVTV